MRDGDLLTADIFHCVLKAYSAHKFGVSKMGVMALSIYMAVDPFGLRSCRWSRLLSAN